MRIHSIVLENFGPFYGQHQLDLGVHENTPVVLIHGENMRGKTSFMNAIKWCLYERALHRLGREIAAHRMISYDAIDSNDYHMSVTLDYEHEGKHCILERHVQAQRQPASDRDLRTTVSLRRDGYFEVAEEIPEIIGDMLHEEIARFFLFDGEMLGHYEVLLSEPGRDAQIVKESIEQIIGLPALQTMARDLEVLRRDAEKRVLRQVRASEKEETLVAKAQQISNEIDAIDTDIQNMQNQLADVDRERAKLRDQLEGISEIKVDVSEMERLEQSVRHNEHEQAEVLDDCQRLLSSCWWMPVASRAGDMLSRMTSQAEAEQARLEKVAVLRHEIGTFATAMANPECPVCSQTMGDQALSEIAARLARGEAELNRLTSDADEFTDSMASIDRLRRFAHRSALDRLRQQETRHRKLGIDIRRQRRQLESVRQRLRAHDVKEISKAQERYDRCIVQLEEIKSDINAKKAERTELQGRLSRHYDEIQRTPGIEPRIVTENAMFGTLESIFTEAVDRFRDSVRLDVEREATALFRQLTTEPDYDKLCINEQYGLSIVDRDGRTILDRSAGAEQVVALALVGALNRCAVRQGPIVMDTPFGRLDRRHRKNILEFVPSMSSQLILLVQSGEFDRDRDLQHLAGKIGREYWLVRDGSSTRSRFDSSAPEV
ncbi:MAG TPA: AAA family ATPase [Anaerolineae bacterium]|nr:AAA family ATPase [Anaerolineae bacterium]